MRGVIFFHIICFYAPKIMRNSKRKIVFWKANDLQSEMKMDPNWDELSLGFKFNDFFANYEEFIKILGEIPKSKRRLLVRPYFIYPNSNECS